MEQGKDGEGVKEVSVRWHAHGDAGLTEALPKRTDLGIGDLRVGRVYMDEKLEGEYNFTTYAPFYVFLPCKPGNSRARFNDNALRRCVAQSSEASAQHRSIPSFRITELLNRHTSLLFLPTLSHSKDKHTTPSSPPPRSADHSHPAHHPRTPAPAHHTSPQRNLHTASCSRRCPTRRTRGRSHL